MFKQYCNRMYNSKDNNDQNALAFNVQTPFSILYIFFSHIRTVDPGILLSLF